MRRPKLSVLIPTYNAAQTLERTLQSLRSQTILQGEMEILVVDGGSTDNTVKIAEQYGAVILDNPKRLPAYAVEIGVHAATGHYLLKTAADESLLVETQLEKRFEFLERHPDIVCLGSDRLLSPPFDRHNFSRSYLNRFGDPFTPPLYIIQRMGYCKPFQTSSWRRRRMAVAFCESTRERPIPLQTVGCLCFRLITLANILGRR